MTQWLTLAPILTSGKQNNSPMALKRPGKIKDAIKTVDRTPRPANRVNYHSFYHELMWRIYTYTFLELRKV